jgi:hypothetical protein
MNIDQFCDEPCCIGGVVSTATPAGIQLVLETPAPSSEPDVPQPEEL